MRLVFGTSEMRVAVQAGEGSSSTLIAMRIKFLLRQDISTSLERWPTLALTDCVRT